MIDDLEKYSRDAVAARLKEARLAKYGSAAELARVVGMKEVTVRAHENGQNGLSHSKARKYAEALGVTAEWLLFGRDGQANDEQHETDFLGRAIAYDGTSNLLRKVPVWQDARAGSFTELPPNDVSYAQSFLALSVPRHDSLQISAFKVADDHASSTYRAGTFVVTGPPASLDLRSGDHVVIARMLPGTNLCETTIRAAMLDDGLIHFTSLGPDGDTVAKIPITASVARQPETAQSLEESETISRHRSLATKHRTRRTALWPTPSRMLPHVSDRNDGQNDAIFVLGIVLAGFSVRDRSGPTIGRWSDEWQMVIPAD